MKEILLIGKARECRESFLCHKSNLNAIYHDDDNFYFEHGDNFYRDPDVEARAGCLEVCVRSCEVTINFIRQQLIDAAAEAIHSSRATGEDAHDAQTVQDLQALTNRIDSYIVEIEDWS